MGGTTKATSFLPFAVELSRGGTAGGIWNSATGCSSRGWFLEERRVPRFGLLRPSSFGGSFHPFCSLFFESPFTVRKSTWAVDK